LHAEQAEATAWRRPHRLDVESAPVVFNGASEQPSVGMDPDGDIGRGGMSRDVGQRPLHESIHRNGYRRRQANGQRLIDRDREAIAPERVDKHLERRRQTQVVENRRAQFVRHGAQLMFDAANEISHHVKPRCHEREVTGQTVDGNANRGEQLAGVVMQGMRDAARLFLERARQRRDTVGGGRRAACAGRRARERALVIDGRFANGRYTGSSRDFGRGSRGKYAFLLFHELHTARQTDPAKCRGAQPIAGRRSRQQERCQGT
jgi:hypothetical protein